MSACGDVLMTEDGKFILTEEGELILINAKTTTEPEDTWMQSGKILYDGWCSDE